jgi:cobalt-zinc-cadmium efflux system outer membrane protein
MRAHRRLVVFVIAAAGSLAAASPQEAGSAFTLKELQAIARAAQPTLESAQAAVEAATGALRQARAYPNLELVIAGGQGRPRDGGGDSKAESLIEIVQPIELPGIRRWRARVAELRVEAAEIDRDMAHATLDSTIARLVYETLLARRQADIARESAEIALRLLGLSERRVEIGESPPLDAVKARSEWFGRRREVLEAERSEEAARAALSLVCGGRLPAGFRVSGALEDPGATPLPDDLAERLRGANPILKRARTAVEQAAARTEAARKETFSRIDLLAGHTTELDRTATNVGVGLTLPLWNRNRGAIAEAGAEAVRAEADVRALTWELETALALSGAAYRTALAEVGLHEEGWTQAAKKSLDIATFSFENGEASILEVLDAQRSYLEVSLAEAESWAGLALARADIERLIAGPIDSESTDEVQ